MKTFSTQISILWVKIAKFVQQYFWRRPYFENIDPRKQIGSTELGRNFAQKIVRPAPAMFVIG
jgi:hypothetical protein